MKISLAITTLIIALAAFFGTQQHREITILTTEWELLETSAGQMGISTDPDLKTSATSVRTIHHRAAHAESIKAFAAELAAYQKKMEAFKKSGQIDENEGKKEFFALLDRLSQQSPADLKILMQTLRDDPSIENQSKEQLIMMSVMTLSTEHPEAALNLIAGSVEDPGLKLKMNQLVPMALEQLGKSDPHAAATWIKANESVLGEKAEWSKMALVALVTEESIASAMTIIQTFGLAEDPEAYQALAQGVKAGSQKEFLKALDDNILSAELRAEALGNLSNSTLIKEDFEAASTWLDSPEIVASDRAAVIKGLDYRSVRNAPEEWLTWISQQADQGETTAATTRKIISGWTEENYVATGQWLQKLEPGTTKNTAVETYAFTLTPYEPAAAADWAETLPPGENRTHLLQEIHKTLKAKDPDAAAALAKKHQLPE